MSCNDEVHLPAFSATTNSTRQLYSLLKCAGFAQRAKLQMSADGLRVAVGDSHTMQAHVFIDKNIFNTFSFNLMSTPLHADDTISIDISLAALLECLQIFGAETSREKWNSNAASTMGTALNRTGPSSVFDQQVLRISGLCRFSYYKNGEPLCLTLEENGVITTCELRSSDSELVKDIPIARHSLSLKIIMKANWLHDAVQELEGSSVERLIIAASPGHPYFSLSAIGPMGSTVFEFSNDKSLLETFQVPEPMQHTYNFTFIKYALKAMSISSKVSIRGDSNGILSLQFMIEQDSGNPSFIDFRYMPYALEHSTENECY